MVRSAAVLPHPPGATVPSTPRTSLLLLLPVLLAACGGDGGHPAAAEGNRLLAEGRQSCDRAESESSIAPKIPIDRELRDRRNHVFLCSKQIAVA